MASPFVIVSLQARPVPPHVCWRIASFVPHSTKRRLHVVSNHSGDASQLQLAATGRVRAETAQSDPYAASIHGRNCAQRCCRWRWILHVLSSGLLRSHQVADTVSPETTRWWHGTSRQHSRLSRWMQSRCHEANVFVHKHVHAVLSRDLIGAWLPEWALTIRPQH